LVRLLAWAFAVGGLSLAVVAALNLFGLARGRLRSDPLGRIANLGLGMMGAGLAGFFWPTFPDGDAPPEPWRFHWFGVMAVGLALLLGPEFWRSYRQGVRTEGDALFFLRVYTDRTEWRPKHLVVPGAFAVSAFFFENVPDNSWWTWVTLIWFFAMCKSLSILPLHRGRREPNAYGSAPKT